jgi:DNA-binding winged helix-turn-helix (wHTH) protein
MPGQILQFNDTELDVGRYEIRRNGRTLRLERLPMELLILLASRKGELVTREQVIEHLWGKGVHLDADQGINTAIRKIRLCLRDTAENPIYVQTVVGKGYRFIPPVRASQRSLPVSSDEVSPKIAAPEPPATSESRLSRFAAMSALRWIAAIAVHDSMRRFGMALVCASRASVNSDQDNCGAAIRESFQ